MSECDDTSEPDFSFGKLFFLEVNQTALVFKLIERLEGVVFTFTVIIKLIYVTETYRFHHF